MRLYAGTSGFSYNEWKGPFYPEKLPNADMLRYYAERLPTVELNNTFYRMPKASVVDGWATQVPDTFRFVVKASRRITHMKRLREVEEPVGYLKQALAGLGERLGLVLFQLPPNLPADRERLERFLALWGSELHAAFEFRHPSWLEGDAREVLREHGTALCVSESEDEPEAQVEATACHAYLRLRRSTYTEAELDARLAALRVLDVDEAYVFFKHEDAGAGPRMAAQFLERAQAGP
jgi:uncharacterized protein YecE (DUF72 family)